MLSNPLRNILLSCLVLSSIVVGACDGDDEEDFGSANVQACEDWLATVYGLDCAPEGYDLMIDCEASYSGTSACDISAYFDCVSATYSCENGMISNDIAAFGECGDLANCG